jgi:hypothetical protein
MTALLVTKCLRFLPRPFVAVQIGLPTAVVNRRERP